MTPMERELLALVQQQQRTIQSLIDTASVEAPQLALQQVATRPPTRGGFPPETSEFLDEDGHLDMGALQKAAEMWRGTPGYAPDDATDKGEEDDKWITIGSIPSNGPSAAYEPEVTSGD